MLTDLIYRLRALLSRRRVDEELQEELRYHVEREAEKYRASGLSAREARRRAQLAIGGVEQAQQRCREVRGTRLVEELLQDTRFALRQLRKDLGFTLTTVIVLGLGIGAATILFAFVDAILVRPLPYRDPSRLVALFERIPVGDHYHLSHVDYLAWKQQNHSFSALDVYTNYPMFLHTFGVMEKVNVLQMSAGFLQTLGVTPALGRDFRPGEDQHGAAPVALLSYAAWQRRFGSDPGVLGRVVTLGDTTYTVIGVLPARFHYAPAGSPEFWVPNFNLCPDNPMCHPFYGVARLKDGVTISEASADLAPIMRQLAVENPQSNRDRTANVLPLTDVILGGIRPTLMTLFCGGVLLALIGLVNVTSLLLVRAERRRQEIAVRGALGASRIRLVRQFAVEGFVLAGSGAAIGLLLATLLRNLLRITISSRVMEEMPYLRSLDISTHSLLFALGICVLSGLLFTAIPAARLLFADMQTSLRDGGRTAVGGSWRRAGAGLVVAELAITVVLLVGAGLLAKSFYRLLHVNLGMDADHLAVLHLHQTANTSDARDLALEQQIAARMATLPGAISAGISEEPAISSGERFKNLFAHYHVFGRPFVDQGLEANTRATSFGYLPTLRVRLLRGRFFTATDDISMPFIVIINQTMAQQLFPDEDPVGKRIVSEYETAHPWEVVGVIDDIHEDELDEKPVAAVYSALAQNSLSDFYVTLRTSQPEDTVLHTMVETVHAIDPGMITDEEQTMTGRIRTSQTAYLHRIAAWIVASFAALALLLGTVGLYGVISYSVGQRTREIGVRMALGAQRAGIHQMILREAARLALLGVATGVLCAIEATTVLRSLLFGVSRWDVEVLSAVVVVLSAAALVASYLPARRAAMIHPTEALRAE